MKQFILLGSLLFSLAVLAKNPPVHVYLIVNDNTMESSTLSEWTSKIYLDSKTAITDFEITHFVYENKTPDIWMNAKKSKIVKYIPETIDCTFSPCERISAILTEKASEKTKLFVGEGIFSCNLRDLRAETAFFSNTIESIQEKIQDELTYNKSAQKELSLIFFIPSKQNFDKAEVLVKQNKYTIKKGESVSLSIETKAAATILWEPSIGLSCSDCKSPKASPLETTTYQVGAYNELGCLSEVKSIEITVENRCEDGLSSCAIDYESDEMLYRRTLDNSKWLMASSQPGSSIYYLICDRNCGEFFNVNVYNESNVKVWNREFKREEIESGNKLHTDHPDSFIFKINLGTISNFDKKMLYKFEIQTRDTEKNSYESYQSPLTKFVDCGFYE